jgi:hypothetical protein
MLVSAHSNTQGPISAVMGSPADMHWQNTAQPPQHTAHLTATQSSSSSKAGQAPKQEAPGHLHLQAELHADMDVPAWTRGPVKDTCKQPQQQQQQQSCRRRCLPNPFGTIAQQRAVQIQMGPDAGQLQQQQQVTCLLSSEPGMWQQLAEGLGAPALNPSGSLPFKSLTDYELAQAITEALTKAQRHC